MLTSELFLTHFDPKAELILVSDASNIGIGTVLLHEDKLGGIKALMYTSRRLITADKNYSKIEKESLSLIFGIKKFHKFIHGRQF